MKNEEEESDEVEEEEEEEVEEEHLLKFENNLDVHLFKANIPKETIKDISKI